MTDTDGGGPSVVVVANPHDAAELTELLTSVGFGVVWSGDGSDETLRRIDEDPPRVVVLSAALDHGDARALAAAVRARSGAIGIVLVGEEHGPVRNALDALDFEVDRFVGRPLAAKALRFAVRSSAKAREAALAAPLTDELAVRLAEATDTAIDDFVRDAMDALPHVDDGWEMSEPRPAPAAAAAAPVEPEPVVAAPVVAEPVVAEPVVAEPVVAEPVVAEPVVAEPDPGPPVREPTLILSDGGAVAVDVAAPIVAAPEDPTAPQPLPPPSSDLARELRHKMSQMAERLFPGRKDAAAGALQMDAHAEIDLTSIGTEAPHEDLALDAGSGADTFAEAAFAPPEPMRTYDSGIAGSKPELRGEIEIVDPRRGSNGTGGTGTGGNGGTGTDEVTGEITGATTHRRKAVSFGPSRGQIGPRDEDVATLMARLYRGAFTGRVILRRDEAEKVVHFDDGRPVFATSNLPHDRMGDLLYREGKITRAQHARSREVVAESGRRMGEILVDMGFLKRRELLPAVRRHIEDVIYSVFAWDSGDYSVVPGESAVGEKIRLSRHPVALIVEGIRRKYGLDLLEVRVGSADAIVSIRDRERLSGLLKEVDLGQAERRAIRQLDGEKSLARVAETADVDLLSVYQICFALIVLGAAEPLVETEDTGVWGRERTPSLVGATDLAIDRERLLAKHAHVEEADYFVLLGVRREASTFEIQRAYEAARRDFAADAFPYEVRTEMSAEIDEINLLLDEAYAVLRDDAMRQAYKANLLD